ncbi:ATP-binding protein [Streptomyces amakusaensis]|uniref:ATP-binding protein n=1 Tax=Streptomyces amakusaensis TaxID=67271 RepID=A0ABW0AP87_9ACTN
MSTDHPARSGQQQQRQRQQRQSQTRRLPLSGTARVVSRCRDFTERALADWGWTPEGGGRAERTEDVLLLVSELVTNACLHAGGPTELVLRHTPDRLRIELSDPSPDLPRRRPRAVSQPGGHGLIVLDRLSLKWGAEPVDGGKVVWAEITPPR